MPILIGLLILIPIAELWFIVQTADAIGVVPTLVALLGVSILGGWLLKREGVATWARLRATLARREIPTNEATDGALILLGGALLITPGFLSDIVGLLLVIPVTRARAKRYARRMLKWTVFRRFARRRPASRIYETSARRVGRRDVSSSSAPSPQLPGEGARRDGAAGSPDRG
jgi:UPF0716 protein FxsA